MKQLFEHARRRTTRWILVTGGLFMLGQMALSHAAADTRTTYSGPHIVVNETGHCANLDFTLPSGQHKKVDWKDDKIDVLDQIGEHNINVVVTFYKNDQKCEGDVSNVVVQKFRRKWIVLSLDGSDA